MWEYYGKLQTIMAEEANCRLIIGLQNIIRTPLISFKFIMRGKLRGNLISFLRQLTLMDGFVPHQYHHQTLYIPTIFQNIKMEKFFCFNRQHFHAIDLYLIWSWYLLCFHINGNLKWGLVMYGNRMESTFV